MQSYDNALLAEQENMIEEGLSNEGLNKPKDAKSVLVRELAATQIALFFERVESNIFASQVRAMKYLNTLSGQETTVDEVAEIFRQAKNKYADIYSNYPFESWLNFMESRDLIELNEDTIRLRQRGKEYLKWRVESGQAGPHYG